MPKLLRQPKLWITLASLAFIAVALAQQAGQIRQLRLVAHGWWAGAGVGPDLAQHPDQWFGLARPSARLDTPGPAVVPLFVRSNLLKYLPGGICIWWSRSNAAPAHWWWTRPRRSDSGSALIVAASLLVVVLGGWRQGLVLLAPLPAC